MRITKLGPADICELTGMDPADIDRIAAQIVNGTLIQVHDQAITKPSQNYRRIVHVSKVWPGDPDDIVVAEATFHLPEGITTLAEGGVGFMLRATRSPKGDAVRLAAHSRLRAWIEHVLAPIKDWQMLRQCRRRGNAINRAVRYVAFVWNLRLAHL